MKSSQGVSSAGVVAGAWLKARPTPRSPAIVTWPACGLALRGAVIFVIIRLGRHPIALIEPAREINIGAAH